MKGLVVSLIAAGALCATAPAAIASSPVRAQTAGVAAQQGIDLGSRSRHWRRAPHHRVVVAPRRYRYVYRQALYPRPYYGYPRRYGYRVYDPWPYSAYGWGPRPFYGYGGPWSGYMMGLGIGW